MRPLLCTLVIALLAIVPASAMAAISQGTAQNTAQAYQNSECGQADYSWPCNNAHWQSQYCYAYGSTRWYCSGTLEEYHWSGPFRSTRRCHIDVQVGGNSNSIVYHYNDCRH